ncbi:YdcF family protein [Paludibaculum fermentans]|uniref:YdcF family protein n=1 Tax=Paludibaculum fermentans TaxID=1473598 RepID=A0A7S7SK45_PALFE|nr:YdcF family protein [Paludibaculum fermentans]QOY87383.1 YdcF family protein [Paludibaculum fermentans]
MQPRSLIFGLILGCLPLYALEPVTAAKTPLAMGADPVRDKNFWLLSALERDARTREAIAADPVLKQLLDSKQQALRAADKACPATPTAAAECYAQPMRWPPAEIDQVSTALRALYAANPYLRFFTGTTLRRSGLYQKYQSNPGPDMLASAWQDCAQGINRMLDLYALGQKPRYAQIDSAAYDVKSAAFGRLIQTAASLVIEDRLPESKLFFQPSLDFALEVLRLHRRDEAGRHEPLDLGENRAALARIRTIPWAKYPWTVIVVPGSGTESVSVRMSPAGRMRCELAAKRYLDHKAPLILVSGGYVHPNQTPWAEAIEMKRLLVEELHIPAGAILIDPHARHTTTNLRNAARLMYRYGIPFGKPALITTDEFQSASIESPVFTARCKLELGYVPHRVIKRVSRFDLEFLPLTDSLQADNTEPLDP